MIRETSTGAAPLAAPPTLRRRWHPAPALRFTALFHAGGAAAVAALPELWPPIVAGLAANHAVLITASLLPRSQLIGRNLVRLPEAAAQRGEVAITFDDGPDPEVTPRVLDLLDAYRARASFFCVGERAAAAPELVREIVRRGHSVENHSHRHSTAFGWYGPWRLRRELEVAQRALVDAAGVPPVFFRAPFGTRNPLLDLALARLGLTLVSWTRRGYDAVDGDAARVLQRLEDGLAAGDVLLLHDGVAVGGRRRAPTVLAVLPQLLERLADRGLKAVSLRTACDGMTASAREDGSEPVAALLDAAVRRYAPAGRFAVGFARGKLGYDPVFVALLRRGIFPDGLRLVDLGCGQGVLLALLVAARDQYRAGRWPADWPPPPRRFSLRGIECRSGAVRRARLALGPEAEIEEADLRLARFAPSDVIALLDVVHYLEPAAQDRLLAAVGDALPRGGVFLMRVGDLAAKFAARLTWVVDQVVTVARGSRPHQFHRRTVPEWVAALERLGFEVSAEPQSEGTPFANVLLVARKHR